MIMQNSNLATFLEDQGVGTKGVDIWCELPLGKEDSIGIVPVVSPEPNKAFATYDQVFDIWARFENATLGKAKLQEVFDILHRRQNYQLDGFHVYLSYAAGMIDDLDRDPEQRHLYKLTVAFVYRELSEEEQSS